MVNLKNKIMKEIKISISHFKFDLISDGNYVVMYQSPTSGKRWQTMISDMKLIDATLNVAFPKQKDLETLRRLCKNG